MRSDSPVCVFLGVVLVSLCFVGTVDATPQIEFVVPTPTNGYVMLQSELDISQNLVNLYNFERKCHENKPQKIFSC